MEILRFAKILEVESNQVLIVKEYDDEEDAYKLNQTAEVDGVRVTMGLGFKDENRCDECFSDYNDENAKKFLDNIKLMFEEA